MHPDTIRLRWSVLVFGLPLVVSAVSAARAQEPPAPITLPDSAPARIRLAGPDQVWHTGFVKLWDNPRCPVVWVPELLPVPLFVTTESLQVRLGEGADTTWLAVDMAAVLSGDPQCAVFVQAGRRAFFETIVRANLLMLAAAESTYYEAQHTFTGQIAAMTRLDGGQLEFTHGPLSGVSVTIEVADTTQWAAAARSLVDTTVVCSIQGTVPTGVPRRTSTNCRRP